MIHWYNSFAGNWAKNAIIFIQYMVLDIFLERIKVSYKYKKENHIDILLSIFIGLFLAVLIYATGCLPFYVHQKASAMMEVYDELKEMKFTEFIKIVRAFFGAAEIIAFANDVADAMGVSVDQEQTAAEIPTV